MTAMWLPTLAGLARLLPVGIVGDHVNVAGTSALTEYTVPAGRAAIITTLVIEQRGGTAYTSIGYDLSVAGAGSPGTILQVAPPGNLLSVGWEGWLWLAETDVVESLVIGGDATSDYRSVVSGVEFDWTDVT